MRTDTSQLINMAELLVEQSPDGIVFADKKGIIRVWNRAAERIFGFRAEEAIGVNLDIIIPERFRDAHWRGFERAINERATKYAGKSMPTRAVRSDGTLVYVELSFSIILDANGDVLGALAHARDITERFEKERADRKRLQELEKILDSKT
ncbi:MAG: PAS domain S-box protein [Desulfatiglans sp.]|jgi:PAS domain S-box-containing protein|nr:PAS domain S-box protein [Desulfatiglans sp.]